jgi:hypothetical protein
MADSPYKRGQKDYHAGRVSPPHTYYSDWYRDEWQRGYRAAEGAQAMTDEKEGRANDLYAGLPASYRAMDELERAVGGVAAEKVKALIEAMIAEAQEVA